MTEMTDGDVEVFEKHHKRHKRPALKAGREELISAIQRGNGLTYDVCLILGCTPLQLYTRLDKLGIRDEMLKARQGLVDSAESVLGSLLSSDNEKIKLDAAKYITERLGRDKGWGAKPDTAIQINGNDVDLHAIFGI